MQARSKETNVDRRRKLGVRCREIMSRAENIKRRQKERVQVDELQEGLRNVTITGVTLPPSPEAPALPPSHKKTGGDVPMPLQAPRSTRQLTIREKTILLKSSRIAGKVFPPWAGDADIPFTEFTSLEPYSSVSYLRFKMAAA